MNGANPFFMGAFLKQQRRMWHGIPNGNKVCLIIIVSNSGANNSASRHDSLNLKGSAESGEKND